MISIPTISLLLSERLDKDEDDLDPDNWESHAEKAAEDEDLSKAFLCHCGFDRFARYGDPELSY